MITGVSYSCQNPFGNQLQRIIFDYRGLFYGNWLQGVVIYYETLKHWFSSEISITTNYFAPTKIHIQYKKSKYIILAIIITFKHNHQRQSKLNKKQSSKAINNHYDYQTQSSKTTKTQEKNNHQNLIKNKHKKVINKL